MTEQETQLLPAPTDPIELVKDTWAQLEAAGDRFPLTFYAVLFDLAPQVRPLFPAGMRAQRDKLIAVLAKVVESVLNPDFDHGIHLAKLRRLGVRHIGFGAQPEHYAVVGEALLTTMGWFVDGWSDEHAEIWGAAYNGVADVMMKAAADADTEQPAWLDVEITEILWTLERTFVTVDQVLPDHVNSVHVRRTDFGGGWVTATLHGNWDVIELDTSTDDLDALVIAAMAPGDRLRVVPNDETEGSV